MALSFSRKCSVGLSRQAFFRLSRKHYSTKPYEVFDRSVKLKHREKMAKVPESEAVEYLRDEVAKRTIERLSFINRDLPKVLDFGSSSGNFEQQLANGADDDTKLVRSKIKEIVMTDSSKSMLNRWKDKSFNEKLNLKRRVVDEETLDHPSFQRESFDAVISNLSLHWVNDLPSVLRKLNILLKPDGLFLASMISEDSIFELRTSLQLAESERKGGMSPRVSPLVKVTDISSLLKQSKFNLVTIDVEEIVVGYPDIFTVLSDIQLMGENNANKIGPGPLHRDILLAAQEIYSSLHGDSDGTLPLTYRVLFMIGWKESSSQPKPLERGSGDLNLKELLEK